MTFITITEFLRNKISNKYYELKNDFFNKAEKKEDEEEFDDEDIVEEDNDFENYIEDYLEEISIEYEEKVTKELAKFIRNNQYKNIMYLIILKDCFEYLKTEKLNHRSITSEEQEILQNLEHIDLTIFFKALDLNDELFFDIITIFLEYNVLFNIEEKYNKRSLLKQTNDNYHNNFKISILDDLQYVYQKRRNN